MISKLVEAGRLKRARRHPLPIRRGTRGRCAVFLEKNGLDKGAVE